jgi:hypothetical protein
LQRGQDREVSAGATEKRASDDALTPGVGALLLGVFLGVALFVYEPALHGPFVSDDNHYIKNNTYVHELSVENFVTIIDPFGAATIEIVNYSPVQLFVHTLAWEAFGSKVRGHHVVNVCLHSLACVLLVFVFNRCGVFPLASVLGGAFFLVHPANVEAVAWISQLKSTLALVLSLLALLALTRHRALATLCFVAALLAKATAAYALPVAVLVLWARRESIPWRWLSSWALVFVVFSIVEFTVHQRSGAAEAVLHDEPLVLARTMMSLAMRYLAMGATSLGVSAFHEPDPVRSWLDPWWLASVVALALLGWRLFVVARRRDVEVAFWVWALVSFGPVSQIFPFLYPLADRYLYFIAPGLIGGTLLAAQEGLDRLAGWLAQRRDQDEDRLRSLLGRSVAIGAAAALVPLALHAEDRAGIWRNPALLVTDAARHYPHGVSALLLEAKRAARLGEAAEAAVAIRSAHDRGFNQFDQLLGDRAFAGVRDHAQFQVAIREMAQGWIESMGARENPSQGELRMKARAHVVREEFDEAIATLRRGLEIGGRMDAQLRLDLQALATRER